MLRILFIWVFIWLNPADRIRAEEQKLLQNDPSVETKTAPKTKKTEDKTIKIEIVEKIPVTKSGEFLVDVPWKSNSDLFVLKFTQNDSFKEVHSKVPFFALPIEARIISLKVFQIDKKLSEEYPPQIVRKRLMELAEIGQNARVSGKWLAYLQRPEAIDWVKKTEELHSQTDSLNVVKPVDEADYAYYETDASQIEKNTSQKIDKETSESFKFQKGQLDVELAVGKFEVYSELNANSMSGKTWQITPRIKFGQSFLKSGETYIMGIEYGSSELKLSHKDEIVQSHFREFNLTIAMALKERSTVGLVLQNLQIPELSEFVTDIDGTNYGKLSASDRTAIGLGTDYQFGQGSRLSLGLSPYLFKGGGYRLQMNGQTPITGLESLQILLGAGYDYVKAARKPTCGTCLPSNKTSLGQIYVSVTATKSF